MLVCSKRCYAESWQQEAQQAKSKGTFREVPPVDHLPQNPRVGAYLIGPRDAHPALGGQRPAPARLLLPLLRSAVSRARSCGGCLRSALQPRRTGRVEPAANTLARQAAKAQEGLVQNLRNCSWAQVPPHDVKPVRFGHRGAEKVVNETYAMRAR
jgi:hypothetical protein